jgi:hypothetical protein
MPLGALAGGFVAHAAGLRAPYVVAGLLCTLSTLAALPLLLAANRTASRAADRTASRAADRTASRAADRTASRAAKSAAKGTTEGAEA